MRSILWMLLLGIVLAVSGCDDSDSEGDPWGKSCNSSDYNTVCTGAGECKFDSLASEEGECVALTVCESDDDCGDRSCRENTADGKKYCGFATAPFGVNSPTFTTGTINQPYPEVTLTVTGDGGAYYFSCPEPCGLPDGLTMDENGKISGTPTKVGDFNFTIVAVNGGKDATVYYNATKLVKNYQISVVDQGYVDPCTPTNPCTETNKTVCTDTDKDGTAECACDADYHDEDGSCVSDTKEVACKDLTTVPENGEQVTADVTITWSVTNGWPEPATCEWQCKEGYVQDGETCTVYVDPCTPTNTCTETNKTVCTDEDKDGVAECACDEGYIPDTVGCKLYVDPCSPTNTCTDAHKTVCADANLDGVAECSCDAGYVLDGDTCKEVTVTAGLMISEYIEGSSNNKALELYNPTESSIDLSTYQIWKISNGGDWPEGTLDLSGTLAAGKTYVICNSSIDPQYEAKCDLKDGTLINFNGDDAVGVAHNGALVDVIGTDGPDVGNGWAVAGVAEATQNHTLVRKESIKGGVTDWATSAGTTAENSQWIVKDIDDFSNLGTHGGGSSGCTDGATQDIPCGVNGNGTQGQTCTAGVWVNSGECVDSDICTNEATQSIACGVNGNGTQAQICTDGQWANDGTCVDTDVCTNDATQNVACGLNGNGTQAQICTDGQWVNDGVCNDSDECTEDATRNVPCGLNGAGAQGQVCTSGAWVNSGSCVDPDVCTNGETQNIACGLNGNGTQVQNCTAGQWVNNGTCSDSDVCVNDVTQNIGCGWNGNGTQAQTCTAGAWVNSGSCVDPDVCTNDATQNIPCGLNDNGTQAQTCTAGQWVNSGSCVDPDTCVNGTTQSISCGLNSNGSQAQTCTSGQWVNDGTCVDSDLCTNGATQNIPCGLNGNGTQAQTCTSGQWVNDGVCVDSDECTENATRNIACGLNSAGTQAQTCTSGSWVDNGTCVDPDVCTNNDTQNIACGLNDNGTQGQTCTSGQWVNSGGCVDPDVCTNGATQNINCGLNNNGTQGQICTSGQWVNSGSCVDPDVCTNGATQNIACGLNNNGTQAQTCTAGQWVNNGTCADSDICVNGTTQNISCGLNGSGTQAQDCTDGAWVNSGSCVDTDVCVNGTTQNVSCDVLNSNNNGTQAQDCTAGQWVNSGTCNDPDVCTIGATENQSCDVLNTNNNGTQSRTCLATGQWDTWGTCNDPDVCTIGATENQSCDVLNTNNNGTQSRTCLATGQWDTWGTCSDPDVCTNADTRDITVCGNGTQPEVCTDGQWANDGACSCNTGWTGAACDQDVDECVANTDTCSATEYCSNTVGSFTCTACNCETLYTVGSSAACSDEVGQCNCETGYDGLTCDTCATGYQDNDGDTFCEPTCATAIAAGLNCGSNGTCDDTLGQAICDCDAGFSGVLCDSCATGYWGTGCTACPGTCDAGDGHGMCNDGDISATSACYCDTGYVEVNEECVASVVINEIDPANGWFEIYNRTGAEIDTSAWYYEVDGSTESDFFYVTTAANGYNVVTGLTINAGIDEIRLYDENDVLVDSITWIDTVDAGKSLGRFPTSNDAAMVLDVPTQNGINQLTIDWASTQWPNSTTVALSAPTETIYGQVYIAGVTDGSYTTSINMIKAQLCYTSDLVGLTNPTCVDVPWESDQGSNHQYATTLIVTDSGISSYKYYYQYSTDDGTTWTPCNLDSTGGSNNAFDAGSIGDLTVVDPNAPASGDGTSGDPYIIATWEHLQWITLFSTRWDKHYLQTADIALPADINTWDGGAGWTPIADDTNRFTGSYDGGGHTIDNLFINRSAVSSQALFGYVGSSGEVKNVGVVNVNITGGDNAAGVVGVSYGVIDQVYSTGAIAGINIIGGVVGRAYAGTISRSYNLSNVTGGTYVGGITGSVDAATVSNCYNTGAISGSGNYIGGIAGGNWGLLENCYSTGTVTGSNSGGILGRSGPVTNCFWDVDTSGIATSFGGTGLNTAQMKDLASFTGWDFGSTWGIETGTYPYLKSNQQAPIPGSKRIFLTSWTGSADFGGIAGGDAICNSDLSRPDTGKNYKALIGISGVRQIGTDWPLAADTTYYRADGVTMIGVTTGTGALTLLSNSIYDGGGVEVWTGLTNSNTVTTNCSNWTSTAGTGYVGQGLSTTQAFSVYSQYCSRTYQALYCVEQ